MQENTIKNLSICERFFQILDYYEDTRYKFSKESGISEAVLSNIYQKKNPPKVEVIEVLLNKYKAVDANWLLTGTGEMLRKTNCTVNTHTHSIDASQRTDIESKYNNNNSGIQKNTIKKYDKSQNTSIGNNIIASEKSTVHAPTTVDNRQYYSDSPDVLRAQIDKMEDIMREKDERLREKDERLREKDEYIQELRETIKELKANNR
jgi:hypothetical protein